VTLALVGFGANLGDPADTLPRAIAACGRLGVIQAVSPTYRTAPIGMTDQPDFLNAVAALETDLDPASLLAGLHSVEAEFGRVRDVRWGPRTLDLDLLWFDGVESHDPDLELPHPRAHEREFVLRPLVDIAPEVVIRGRTASEWLSQIEPQGVELA
jgi:2-amino-4-hydroxy-6-hydroxymethyldihydropteridine diphosphokinase